MFSRILMGTALLLLAAQVAVARGVVCESHDYAYERCDMNTRGGVRLVEQLSRSSCDRGLTWGVGRHFVWVSRGCSAVFERHRRVHPDDDFPRRWPGRHVTCESRNYGYTECSINTRRRVRLVEQLSRSRCVRGESWGVGHRRVWVDRGCAAVFRSGR